MTRELIERLGMLVVIASAVIAAEPRLHVALEDTGDPRPHRFALNGEIMGKVLGLVISWSGSSPRLQR